MKTRKKSKSFVFKIVYTNLDNCVHFPLTGKKKFCILFSNFFFLFMPQFTPAPPEMFDAKEMVRVSISEAARLFGVNAQTIRRAIKSGDLTYVVVANRYKINFESLIKWSQEKTTVRNKSNRQGIGQFVDRWKIHNTLYSPSLKSVKKDENR